MNWKALRDYALARTAEKTTWSGALTLVITFGGVAIKPEYTEQIAVVGSAVGSLLLILLKEKGSAA